MKTHVALAAALLALPAFAYDSVEALIKDHLTKEAEALKAYMAANPEAEDLQQAEQKLAYDYMQTGQNDAAIDLLRQQYDKAIAAGETDELQPLFVGAVMPLVQLYQDAGRKEDGVAFVEKVRSDLAKHPMAEDIGPMLDNLAAGFGKPGVGEPMEITITALNGDKVSTTDLKGKVVLVDFWATWCGPCVKEIPHLKETYAKYKDQGFEIIGISLDDDRAQLDDFIADKGITWPIQFDEKAWENDLAKQFGIQSIPATFLLGKDGKIAATDLRGDDLEKEVVKQLGL